MATEALTREQLEALFARREVSEDEMANMSELQQEQHQAFAMCIQDLRWPVTRETEGHPASVANIDYIAALVAYHLVRCGWRMDMDKRAIKARKVIGRGVPTGAVEWVGINEPDDPLANIGEMTMKEVAALTPSARAEAIRRLAPNTPNDLPMPDPSWQVKPNINIVDIPQMPFVDSEK